MLDNDVEAVGGLRIDEIALLMEDSLPWLPNLVLMHFGSNDATQNHDVSTAHERLGALIDRVVHAVAGVTVIVSTLIPSTNPTWEANIDIINANMPAMVETRVNQGKKVQLVDMHSGYITSADISDDNLHPTDGKNMLWYSAAVANWYHSWVPVGNVGAHSPRPSGDMSYPFLKTFLIRQLLTPLFPKAKWQMCFMMAFNKLMQSAGLLLHKQSLA